MRKYVLSIISSIVFISIIILMSLIGKKAPLNQEEYLMAVLWHQTSAEYVALTHQAYNIAKLRIEADLDKKYGKPKAIVVDVDETVLNNSPFNAREIIESSYPTGFKNWIHSASCAAIPGAVEFLNFASDNGYKIFYLSNRNTSMVESTMENLLEKGFPQIEFSHFLFRDKESNKEARRKLIKEENEIVMLIGDNLNDFSEIFFVKSTEERLSQAISSKEIFGDKWIVLPNCMHGAWKKALYDNQHGLSQKEKKDIYIKSLQFN